MSRLPKEQDEVIHAYRQTASRYDSTVRLFNIFSKFGFDIPAWRDQAVGALNLSSGDTVIEIGCGTGLNFPRFQEAIGPGGRIIAVDISVDMLHQARQRVADHGWENVDLVCADASQFEYPPNVDGILSTFVMVLIPECEEVVSKACQALAPGARLGVLDMAWPRGWPLWWRHVLFFLKSYGVTEEVLKRRSWDRVWKMMDKHLVDVYRTDFWMGFFYLAAGTRRFE